MASPDPIAAALARANVALSRSAERFHGGSPKHSDAATVRTPQQPPGACGPPPLPGGVSAPVGAPPGVSAPLGAPPAAVFAPAGPPLAGIVPLGSPPLGVSAPVGAPPAGISAPFGAPPPGVSMPVAPPLAGMSTSVGSAATMSCASVPVGPPPADVSTLFDARIAAVSASIIPPSNGWPGPFGAPPAGVSAPVGPPPAGISAPLAPPPAGVAAPIGPAPGGISSPCGAPLSSHVSAPASLPSAGVSASPGVSPIGVSVPVGPPPAGISSFSGAPSSCVSTPVGPPLAGTSSMPSGAPPIAASAPVQRTSLGAPPTGISLPVGPPLAGAPVAAVMPPAFVLLCPGATPAGVSTPEGLALAGPSALPGSSLAAVSAPAPDVSSLFGVSPPAAAPPPSRPTMGSEAQVADGQGPAAPQALQSAPILPTAMAPARPHLADAEPPASAPTSGPPVAPAAEPPSISPVAPVLASAGVASAAAPEPPAPVPGESEPPASATPPGAAEAVGDGPRPDAGTGGDLQSPSEALPAADGAPPALAVGAAASGGMGEPGAALEPTAAAFCAGSGRAEQLSAPAQSFMDVRLQPVLTPAAPAQSFTDVKLRPVLTPVSGEPAAGARLQELAEELLAVCSRIEQTPIGRDMVQLVRQMQEELGAVDGPTAADLGRSLARLAEEREELRHRLVRQGQEAAEERRQSQEREQALQSHVAQLEQSVAEVGDARLGQRRMMEERDEFKLAMSRHATGAVEREKRILEEMEGYREKAQSTLKLEDLRDGLLQETECLKAELAAERASARPLRAELLARKAMEGAERLAGHKASPGPSPLASARNGRQHRPSPAATAAASPNLRPTEEEPPWQGPMPPPLERKEMGEQAAHQAGEWAPRRSQHFASADFHDAGAKAPSWRDEVDALLASRKRMGAGSA